MATMTPEQVKAHIEAAILKATSQGYRVCADRGWGVSYSGKVMTKYDNKVCCAGGAFLLFGPPELVRAPSAPDDGAAEVFGQAFGMNSGEVLAFIQGFDSVFLGDQEEDPCDRTSLTWRNLGSLMGQFAKRHNGG